MHNPKAIHMPETSKSSDFELVSLSVNNKTYTKMMRRGEAQAYRERQKLVGEVVPEVKAKFDSLIEKLDSVFADFGVPKTVGSRLIGNEKRMYDEFIKPGIEARIGSICKEYIDENGFGTEKADNEAFRLKDRLNACIEESSNAIGNGKIGFHDTAILAYEKLEKSLAEILEIKAY